MLHAGLLRHKRKHGQVGLRLDKKAIVRASANRPCASVTVAGSCMRVRPLVHLPFENDASHVILACSGTKLPDMPKIAKSFCRKMPKIAKSFCRKMPKIAKCWTMRMRVIAASSGGFDPVVHKRVVPGQQFMPSDDFVGTQVNQVPVVDVGMKP